MDIVCAADNNYIVQCRVMLTSLLESNPGERITVHLLSDRIGDQGLAQIESTVSSLGGRLCVYPVDPAMLSRCPIAESSHLSLATYNRLLMAELLPPDIDKVLYLDCDMVICRSLRELWATPLDDCALAAVEERGCTMPDVYDRLRYDPKRGYFNAGVLLINLAYWRRIDSVKLFFDFIAANHDRIDHDQDVLNALFHDKYLPLDCRWNVEEAFYHHYVLQRLDFDPQVRRALLHPAILHYTWKPKPWNPECKHPFRSCYFRNLMRVPGHTPPRKTYLRALAASRCFSLVLRLGIRRRCFYPLK